ncbi:unnamed protein product [Caenorhabditis bovis]|uniref:non-specific serine/threonine protein kinase n=1 Tax=Caenorhabditis bovis TaxID=2654633 RepID=A0A8S1EZC7_9PELO|nr:unnamed protein product [Caenorhabditis bovis]
MADLDLEKIVLVGSMNRELLQSICNILDIDEAWEQIAPHMPGILMKDIDGCRRYQKMNKSPTLLLLRIWSSKGYTTDHLYQLFAKTKMVRCMRIIMPAVSEHLHHLEKRVLNPSKSARSSKPASVAASSVKGSSYATRLSEQRKQNASTTPSSTANLQSTSQAPLRIAIEGTLPVSYADLEIATNSFSPKNIIGKGGYGIVYHGDLRGTGAVAVKRIVAKADNSPNCSKIEKERLRQSLQELRTLARFRHDNILPIYAYSLEGPEPCLVYQFMANGSLEDRLLCRKGTLPLTWTQKHEISLGAARGLDFLHTFAKTPVIHGDVKTANILLDKHMEPKLGDFGLSRDGQKEIDVPDKCPLIASHIKGTLAYLPPEFITSKILSTKLDVYSFGIVLLEVATGLRAYSDTREPRGLIEFCQKHREDANFDVDELRRMIIDKRTPKYSNDRENNLFEILIELGLSAGQKDRTLRPPMSKIVDILQTYDIAKLAELSLG